MKRVAFAWENGKVKEVQQFNSSPVRRPIAGADQNDLA